MTDAPLTREASPNELRDPFVRRELKRATVWLGLAGAIALAVILVQPLLIIFAGLVFAALLDGDTAFDAAPRVLEKMRCSPHDSHVSVAADPQRVTLPLAQEHIV